MRQAVFQTIYKMKKFQKVPTLPTPPTLIKRNMKMTINENENGIVYKATNRFTNDVYIGATTQSIEDRKNDHICKSNNNKGHKFHQAISTFGPDAFDWVQIDTASTLDELAKKEVKYIEEYSSQQNVYNCDKGGGFKKPVYQYNLDGTLLNIFDDLTSAGKSINKTKQAISRACLSVSHTLSGYYWSYDYQKPFKPEKDNRKKAVLQFDLEGNLLAEYVSASEASRKTTVLKSCITKCCRGERKTSGGFIWKYAP